MTFNRNFLHSHFNFKEKTEEGKNIAKLKEDWSKSLQGQQIINRNCAQLCVLFFFHEIQSLHVIYEASLIEGLSLELNYRISK